MGGWCIKTQKFVVVLATVAVASCVVLDLVSHGDAYFRLGGSHEQLVRPADALRVYRSALSFGLLIWYLQAVIYMSCDIPTPKNFKTARRSMSKVCGGCSLFAAWFAAWWVGVGVGVRLGARLLSR